MQYLKSTKMDMPACVHILVRLPVSKILCLCRAALEDTLKTRVLEIKKQHDIYFHKQMQKDKELRNLKRMALQLNVIYDSLKEDKLQLERLKLEVCMNVFVIRILNLLARNLTMDSFDW